MDQLERKAAQQREVDLLLLQIDERNADLVAQRPQRGLLADQPEVDGGDVEPRGLRPVEPKLVELLGREQPALYEDRACFHRDFRWFLKCESG